MLNTVLSLNASSQEIAKPAACFGIVGYSRLRMGLCISKTSKPSRSLTSEFSHNHCVGNTDLLSTAHHKTFAGSVQD